MIKIDLSAIKELAEEPIESLVKSIHDRFEPVLRIAEDGEVTVVAREIGTLTLYTCAVWTMTLPAAYRPAVLLDFLESNIDLVERLVEGMDGYLDGSRHVDTWSDDAVSAGEELEQRWEGWAPEATIEILEPEEWFDPPQQFANLTDEEVKAVITDGVANALKSGEGYCDFDSALRHGLAMRDRY
ncbi:hypothetical protein [Deinococcus yunweiensis]|uniref:hypothetical protein n=1 Tax=Deinococcus yunweiensis TaxID=367282 RepID=UPI00398EEF10